MQRQIKWFGPILRVLVLVALVMAHVIGLARTASAQGSAGQIVFESNRDGNLEIYIMNPDGSGQTRLTNNPGSDFAPTLSPDGSKIAFWSNRDGNNEVYIMNVDGTGQTNLTNNPADDAFPRFSPDGSKITFHSTRAGNFAIYVMNVDGSNPVRLTNNPISGGDQRPCFSPDGTKIAFDSTLNGNVEIFVMNADGTGQTNVTNNPGFETDPSFSPDGSKIVFNTLTTVEVINVDGTGRTTLASGAHAVFSPDGSKILFVTNRDGNNEIYSMNADGSSQTRITNNPASDEKPHWGATPALSINDVSVVEGNSGTTNAIFTVSLDASYPTPVTVDYATADNTANAGSDYTAKSGTLTFAPGDTSKTITVLVNGNAVNETNETFFVDLSNPVGGILMDAHGIGTIINDDPPEITIADTTISEGNSGTTNRGVRVSLSNPVNFPVTVGYATANGSVNPATAGSDYTAKSGTLTFAPGVLFRDIAVPIVGDVLDEANETFLINLTNPTNATITDNQGVVTIQDDDTATISINDVTVKEGTGGTSNAVFTVTLSALSDLTFQHSGIRSLEFT